MFFKDSTCNSKWEVQMARHFSSREAISHVFACCVISTIFQKNVKDDMLTVCISY